MKMKLVVLSLVFILFYNNIFSQNNQSKTIQTIKIKFLSVEAISNQFLDSNGVKHPVHNDKSSALIYLQNKIKTEKSKNSSIEEIKKANPKTLYVWKTPQEDQDDKKEEVIKFDILTEKEVFE